MGVDISPRVEHVHVQHECSMKSQQAAIEELLLACTCQTFMLSCVWNAVVQLTDLTGRPLGLNACHAAPHSAPGRAHTHAQPTFRP